MVFTHALRRTTAIWLTAVLLVVSFASVSHIHKHLDDGSKAECTLCFHQHQLNKALPGISLTILVEPQTFIPELVQKCATISAQHFYFHSRAPPLQQLVS